MSFAISVKYLLNEHDFLYTCTHAAYLTARNLELIEWKNEQGEKKKFRLKKLICHKWKQLGTLLEIPLPTIDSWEQQYRGDASSCITAVLSQHWMENPTEYYPLTWEGLDRLLNDAELSQVAEELKQALNNPL